MKVRTVLGGIALFGLGVAVGMHGRDMLADTSHHIYHSHGGHGGSSRFKPFEDIDDLPFVRETKTDGEGLKNEF